MAKQFIIEKCFGFFSPCWILKPDLLLRNQELKVTGAFKSHAAVLSLQLGCIKGIHQKVGEETAQGSAYLHFLEYFSTTTVGVAQNP